MGRAERHLAIHTRDRPVSRATNVEHPHSDVALRHPPTSVATIVNGLPKTTNP
jgi:hypothetical protein